MARKSHIPSRYHSALIFLVIALSLPVLLIAAYTQVRLNPKAYTPNIPSSVSYYGPGELTDMLVKTTLQGAQSFHTTFNISGPRVQNLTTLSGTYRYWNNSSGSPVEATIPLTFSKSGSLFYGTADLNFSGCIDFTSGTTYVASICTRTNAVGYNASEYAYSADTELPFIYVNGQGYTWGQNHSRMRLLYYMPSHTPWYALQSITLPFDKNLNPYYQTSNNFKPTNFYWSLTSGIAPTSLVSLEYWLRDNSGLNCQNSNGLTTIYSDPATTSDIVSYPVSNVMPEGNGCWFRTASYQAGDFPVLQNKFVSLFNPNQVPTPTPSPIPTTRISPTPLPPIKCSIAPSCIKSKKPCKIKEPVGGWCPVPKNLPANQ